MKLLIYGDVHWSTYSSIIRSRGKDYSTRLENLIKSVSWAESLAEHYNCDSVICLGDFFDRPDLNAEELSALLKVVWAKNKPHYFIVGNHESTLSTLEYNSTNALNNEGFVIVDKPLQLNTLGTDILFIPYVIEENRKSIEHYWKETTSKETTFDNVIGTRKKIIFSHNDIKGIQYGAWTSTDGFEIEDIEANSDLYINGHLHNGAFINDKETILNLGILSGQNFGEDASRYSHLVCILDTETLDMQFFENPHAFNFYKLNIDNERDIEKLFHLKNNAVITIRCEESLVEKVRDTITANNISIVEFRIVSYKLMTDAVISESTASALNSVDYLKQFYTFILEKIDSTVVSPDILKEELNKVVM